MAWIKHEDLGRYLNSTYPEMKFYEIKYEWRKKTYAIAFRSGISKKVFCEFDVDTINEEDWELYKDIWNDRTLMESTGQYSLFDYCADPENRKPCEYSFKRYIGQKVGAIFLPAKKTGTIVKIEQYYTIIDVGDRFMVGGPSTIWPIEGGDQDGSSKKDG